MLARSRVATCLANWLTPRRIRAQATILALCLWTVCAVDFATPGLFDRAGNIKFQDFLSFYISGKLIAKGQAADLYDRQHREAETVHVATDAFVRHACESPHPTIRDPSNRFQPKQRPPPQSLRTPIRTPLPPAGATPIPRRRRDLGRTQPHRFLRLHLSSLEVVPRPASHTPARSCICAVAFPPLFHFFVRGQNSVLALACFTAAYLAFRAKQDWLAGIALGCLIFKPQFLVAIPIVLLLSQAWKTLTGLLASAAAQLAFARIYFGPAVMHAYLDTLWHISRIIGALELSLAPIQMHSLRSFWSLLIPWAMTPWPQLALALYILSSIIVIAMAASTWKSSAPLALRFSALDPRRSPGQPASFRLRPAGPRPRFAPATRRDSQPSPNPHPPPLKSLLYLAFLLPLFGPLSQWTHLQLSVPVFTALLWTIYGCRRAASLSS